MTRYILTQDMKAIVPFMDGDQIKAVKRPSFSRYEKPEEERNGPYDVNVYLPDGMIVRGRLGTYKTLTAAIDMMSILFDNLSDDVPVISMMLDEEMERTRKTLINNGGYVFYQDDFSFENAFRDCKEVFDRITDSEKYQEADTGTILYHAAEILYALNVAMKEEKCTG